MTTTSSDAIAAIYACATQPERWPTALHEIAATFGDVGGLLIHRRHDGRLATLVSPGLIEAAELYHGGWWRCDIRAERALDHLYAESAGAALTDRHVATDEEIRTHPIYTQFLAPLGLRWAASVQVSPRSEAQVGLSVLRAATRPPYGDDELATLADLGRHVEQSLRLGLRLAEAEAVTRGLGEALSHLSNGVFVVDAARRVAFANLRAQHLAATVFCLKDGLLSCRSAAHQRRFAALLAGVGQGEQAAAPPSSPLVVETGEGRAAVYVFPLGGDASDLWGDGGPCAAVLVIDLAPGAPLDPGLVRDVYGLTLGEARVAALVGAGITPRDAALKLRIAEETVRSVLKRVFSKLDVSRQAELTDLFTRLRTVRPSA